MHRKNKKIKTMANGYAGIGGNIKMLPNILNITSIEINTKIASICKKTRPDSIIIIGDAHEFLRTHCNEFDLWWLSRPCQSHTKMIKFTKHKLYKFPDFGLYEEIVFLQHFAKGLWVVENVIPYYTPLIKPTIQIGRHLFWSNFPISPYNLQTPNNFINKTDLKGKKELMDWLGIYFEENIYYDGNHDPSQILRNCVHPKIGLHIFNCAANYKNQK